MATRWAWRAAQRASWASSSASMLAKCWVTSASLVSGQQSQEMLGGLQLGRIGRQEQQVNVFGHPQIETRVPSLPAGPIQHEHDLLLGPRPHGVRKDSQLRLEQGNGDRGRPGAKVKEGAARGGMHEANEGAPRKAVLDGGERSLPDRGPHAAQHGLEANTMFVRGPELHLRRREGGGHCSQERPDLFLNSACCSGSASACRGRGTCWLCLRRCR